MKKKIIVLVCLTLVAKTIAFLKEMVLAYVYGTSQISDAYVMAISIPLMLYSMLSAGIISGFIPIYGEIKNSDQNHARSFAESVYGGTLIIGAFFAGVCYIFSSQILGVLANGFPVETFNTTLSFLKICCISIVINSLLCFLLAICQAEGKTSIMGVISIPLNLSVVFAILFSKSINNCYILPIGYAIGSFLQYLLCLFVSNKAVGKVLVPSFEFKDEHVKLLVINSGVLLLGASLTQINLMIDKMLASSTFVGGVTTLEYANRVIDLISGIVTISFSTVLFPRLVSCAHDKDKFNDLLNEGFFWFLIVMIPIVIYACIFSADIIKIIYFRGAFGQEDVINTSGVFLGYALGLIPFGFRELLTKAYYATKDVKIPVINSSLGMILNIILNFILIRIWGLKGLAIATSIAALITSVLLAIGLKTKINVEVKKEYLGKIIKHLVAVVVIALLFKYVNSALGGTNLKFIFVSILYYLFTLVEVVLLSGIRFDTIAKLRKNK